MEIQLRPLKEADETELQKAANNENISKQLRDNFPYPFTIETARTYINTRLSDQNASTYVIAVDSSFAGIGSMYRQEDIYHNSMEIGYWLAEPFWGKGIASKVVNELVGKAFENSQIVRVFALTFSTNAGSRKVLEKNNFHLEGIRRKAVVKNGEILDDCLYAITR